MAEKKQIIDWVKNGLELTVIAYGDKDKKPLATFNTADLPEDSKDFLMDYGKRQKLADSVSGEKELTGKITGMKEMWERLKKGGDALKAERGGGGPSVQVSKIVANLLPLKGKKLEEAWANLSIFMGEADVAKIKKAYGEAKEAAKKA